MDSSSPPDAEETDRTRMAARRAVGGTLLFLIGFPPGMVRCCCSGVKVIIYANIAGFRSAVTDPSGDGKGGCEVVRGSHIGLTPISIGDMLRLVGATWLLSDGVADADVKEER
jgi:hypothetical protein